MIRPLALAIAITSLSAGAEGPSFAPTPGTSVTRTFATTAYLELDDLSIQFGGMEVTDMIGDVEAAFELELGLEATDVFERLGDGRPQRLTRSFDEISGEFTMEYSADIESGEQSSSMESELEGATVIFDWDEDLEAHLISFEDDEGDEELLEGLQEDLDLRAFLPPGSVDVGDAWEVEPAALGSLLMLGGVLGTLEDPEAAGSEDGISLDSMDPVELLESLLDGDVTCTWKGVRDEEGVQVGVIEVSMEVDSTTDLSEALMGVAEEASGGDLPDDFTIDQASLGLEVEGEGLLLWNMEAGHFHYFEAQTELELSFEAKLSGEGEEIDALVVLSGDLEFEASTTAR